MVIAKRRSKSSKDLLYEQVADRVTQMIRKGSLKSGDRIPSIRRMSDQMSVAISTIMEAYRLLEDRGLVEARPQSGYFVRPKHSRRIASATAPPEPELQRLSLKAGPVRTLQGVLDGYRAAAGSDMVPLGAAMAAPEFLPLEQLNRILARTVRDDPEIASRYEFSPGLRELREVIARRSMDAGCSFGPDDIVITTGATEALMLSLQAIAESGDTIAVESPCYFGLLHILRVLGLQAVEVSTDPRSGMSLDALEQLLDRDSTIKAVVLNPNVHNPLGCIMPDDKKRHIADLLGQHGVPVIEDDTYGDLAFDSPRPRCIRAFDHHDNVMVCGSFTKTLAPGYRIGWVAPGPWIDTVNELKLVSSLGSATPPQLAMARYLSTGGFDRHLRRQRRVYREQLQLLSDTVQKTFPPGTRATRAGGGYLLWIELPKSVDSHVLQEQAMEAGIGIAPGTMFSSRKYYRNCIRLNAAIRWSPKVEKAVATLGELATSLARNA